MSPRLVLAADPTMEGDGRLLGKPADPAEAAAHLCLLSSRGTGRRRGSFS